MGKALIVIVIVVLLVYAFFDLLATPSERVRWVPKFLWFVVVLLPVAGPLLWILTGQRRDRGQPPRAPGGQYGWPGGGRPPARGPDDDPDFLRGL
jgi:hypothetical protein